MARPPPGASRRAPTVPTRRPPHHQVTPPPGDTTPPAPGSRVSVQPHHPRGRHRAARPQGSARRPPHPTPPHREATTTGCTSSGPGPHRTAGTSTSPPGCSRRCTGNPTRVGRPCQRGTPPPPMPLPSATPSSSFTSPRTPVPPTWPSSSSACRSTSPPTRRLSTRSPSRGLPHLRQPRDQARGAAPLAAFPTTQPPGQ